MTDAKWLITGMIMTATTAVLVIMSLSSFPHPYRALRGGQNVKVQLLSNSSFPGNGNVTEEEWVLRWICAYGDDGCYARYLWRRFTGGLPTIPNNFFSGGNRESSYSVILFTTHFVNYRFPLFSLLTSYDCFMHAHILKCLFCVCLVPLFFNCPLVHTVIKSFVHPFIFHVYCRSRWYLHSTIYCLMTL